MISDLDLIGAAGISGSNFPDSNGIVESDGRIRDVSVGEFFVRGCRLIKSEYNHIGDFNRCSSVLSLNISKVCSLHKEASDLIREYDEICSNMILCDLILLLLDACDMRDDEERNISDRMNACINISRLFEEKMIGNLLLDGTSYLCAMKDHNESLGPMFMDMMDGSFDITFPASVFVNFINRKYTMRSLVPNGYIQSISHYLDMLGIIRTTVVCNAYTVSGESKNVCDCVCKLIESMLTGLRMIEFNSHENEYDDLIGYGLAIHYAISKAKILLTDLWSNESKGILLDDIGKRVINKEIGGRLAVYANSLLESCDLSRLHDGPLSYMKVDTTIPLQRNELSQDNENSRTNVSKNEEFYISLFVDTIKSKYFKKSGVSDNIHECWGIASRSCISNIMAMNICRSSIIVNEYIYLLIQCHERLEVMSVVFSYELMQKYHELLLSCFINFVSRYGFNSKKLVKFDVENHMMILYGLYSRCRPDRELLNKGTIEILQLCIDAVRVNYNLFLSYKDIILNNMRICDDANSILKYGHNLEITSRASGIYNSAYCYMSIEEYDGIIMRCKSLNEIEKIFGYVRSLLGHLGTNISPYCPNENTNRSASLSHIMAWLNERLRSVGMECIDIGALMFGGNIRNSIKILNHKAINSNLYFNLISECKIMILLFLHDIMRFDVGTCFNEISRLNHTIPYELAIKILRLNISYKYHSKLTVEDIEIYIETKCIAMKQYYQIS